MRDRIMYMLVGVMLTLSSNGQQIQVNGGFLEDSLQIGQKIHFWMTANYPAEMELMFPDSNYSFEPYEYLGKYFEPTRLTGTTAIDSTVYALQSFEIDAVQYLKLPAFILNGTDSMTIDTPIDSIYFYDLVETATDTTQMKQNVSYLSVNRQFNQPLFWILIGVIVLAIGIVYFIFGDRIRTKLRIRKLQREYRSFSARITDYIHSLKKDSSPDLAEKALIDWKHYFERLESQPFSKLTTKEILELDFTSELKDALNGIDRSIYGRLDEEDIYKRFQSIEDFTQHRFSVKLETLKQGESK